MKKIFYVILSVALLAFTACDDDNTSSSVDFQDKCDVVVIGAGGAGLSSACQSLQLGLSVIVVEKNDAVGGNTEFATGGINASGTQFQKEHGIEDSDELFYDDTMRGGYNKNNPELVRTLVQNSRFAIEWLSGIGIDLSDVGFLAGSSVARSHRPTAGYVGQEVIKKLHQEALTKGADFRLASKVTDLIADDANRVVGVAVTNGDKHYNIGAKAVVIATGGFSSNRTLVEKYSDGRLSGFISTNKPSATGDALSWLNKLNIATVDMGAIQTHPTCVSNGFMITEAVRGNGAILVNKEGLRFCNEMGTRDVVSAAVLAQTGAKAYILLDRGIYESLPAIDYYCQIGHIKECKTVAELAEQIGCPEETLARTIENYSDMQHNAADNEFDRPGDQMVRALETPPYYYGEIMPAVHHTMGGLKIDSKAHVIDNNGKIIPGLYAAGEVTGGVHGANRLGGTSMTDIIVFGRIAAKTVRDEME